TGPQVATLFAGLDPEARAFLGVAWAGEDDSPNWLDVGREYTERWHHQQQIREAVGATFQTAAPWLAPLLALSVRALPRVYAKTAARAGEAVELRITGEAGGGGAVVRTGGRWPVFGGPAPAPPAPLGVGGERGWRL